MPSQSAPDIYVVKAESDTNYNHVFGIRTQVFVEEQAIAQDDEYDGLDNVSTIYLAFVDGVPAGTARRRRLPGGAVRFERMAVLKEYRRMGVGQTLLEELIRDIPPETDIIIHAQVFISPLFERFGFIAEGEPFEEAGIIHRKMRYQGNIA